MGAEHYADWLAAIRTPGVVRAMLEDYRAGLGVDRASNRTLQCPTLVAWSTLDDMEELYGNPVDVWRPWATHLRGVPIDSEHHVAEDNSDDLVAAQLDHLVESSAWSDHGDGPYGSSRTRRHRPPALGLRLV